MKSKTSFFNGTLLKKNVTRYLPVWALYLFGMIIVFPLELINYFNGHGSSLVAEEVAQLLRTASLAAGTFGHMIYGIMCASVCFSYLHKPRSAYMLHAFPVTRNSLFLTNLLSGLLFALVPQLLTTALNFGAAGILEVEITQTILQSLLMWLLQFLFFYGLAVFCMILTGKLAAGVLIYFVLNFAVVVTEALTRIIVVPLLYGLSANGLLLTSFSPVVYILLGSLRGATLDLPWIYLAIIAGIGIVLMALSWLLYRRRHLEAAGEVVAYKAAKPVFKYVVTYLASLCLGLLLAGIINRSTINQEYFYLIVCLLVGGLLGYLGAEMLLRRTVKVFQGKIFIGYVVYAVVLVACIVSIRVDLFGVVRYIPKTEEIQSVKLESQYGDGYITLTEPEDIQLVRSIQQYYVERWKSNHTVNDDYSLEIEYRLKSGAKVNRVYDMDNLNEELQRRMEQMLSRPEVIQTYYDSLNLKSAWWGSIESLYDYEEFILDAAEMSQLYQCLCQDIQAGRITLLFMPFTETGTISYQLHYRAGDYGIRYLMIPESATETVKYIESLTTNAEDFSQFSA